MYLLSHPLVASLTWLKVRPLREVSLFYLFVVYSESTKVLTDTADNQ